MYRKRDKAQQSMDDYIMPFGGKLRTDNRWVKQARRMPWDLIEEMYAESMSGERGAGTISARIAFGALYIKESEGLTDEGTVEYIAENPYAQYFLGLHEFVSEPLFDASMMVHFRKRLPAEKIEQINRTCMAAGTRRMERAMNRRQTAGSWCWTRRARRRISGTRATCRY